MILFISGTGSFLSVHKIIERGQRGEVKALSGFWRSRLKSLPKAHGFWVPGSSWGLIGMTVQISVRPITFLWFDIGLPYLVNGSIIIRRYVSCIHDPNMTLNFDLKVIGFLTNFLDRSITYFWIDIGLPYLAHGCITIKRCHVHSWSRFDVVLSFDLQVKFIGFYHVFLSDL